MKYDTQTRRQRAEDLTSEVMQYLGAREVAKIFREGDPTMESSRSNGPTCWGSSPTTRKRHHVENDH